MSDKVIAVMDKPKNCQNCVWGICKYSTPLSTMRKGYYCQLKEPKDRVTEDFAYDDDVRLGNCPLVSLEEHEKEIRDKAIDEFADKLKENAESMVESDCGGINDMSYERAYNRGLFDLEELDEKHNA